MNKLKFLLIAILAVLLLCPFLPSVVPTDAATESLSECLVEVSSRRFLHEKDADKRLPMASTTKVLTALLILDEENLDVTVTVPAEAAGTEGSSVYLKAGEEITVRDLLYGLMLRSGNDCAVTLAIHHSGTVEKFAEAMNRKAVKLGAVNSHFANPHGLPDPNHYTTARDFALISASAMENETFREIVSCKYYEPRGWKNKNKLLWTYEGATGVKTGFTLKAGRCLVSAAERNGMRIVSVVLNSPQMFERTEELFNNAFGQYELVQLCEKEYPDGYGVKYEFFYPLTESEKDKIQVVFDLNSPLPEHAGEIAGTMQIYLENRLLFSQNLFMI